MSYNIITLRPSIWDVRFAGQAYRSREVASVKTWNERNHADLTFNLGLFNMSTGEGYTYVRNETGDLGYGGKSETLWINNENCCKGYSNGIIQGKVSVDYPMGGKRTRNGIGITTDGSVILAQSSHLAYEEAFARAVNEFIIKDNKRVKLFVLQDGGGSTSEYSGLSGLGFYPEGRRNVATVTCASLKAIPRFERTLRIGSRGEDVLVLQIILGGIQADGSFGFETYRRLKEFQKAVSLTADGSFGPITRRVLTEIITKHVYNMD